MNEENKEILPETTVAPAEEVATPEVVPAPAEVQATPEPVVEEPVVEEPVVEAVAETPAVEPAPVETPAEAPVEAEVPTEVPKEEPTTTETPVTAEPVAAEPVVETPATPAPEPNKKGNGGIIIAVVLLILAIAFVVLMPYLPFFSDSKKPENNTNTNTNTTPQPAVATAKDYEGVYESETKKLYLYNTGKNQLALNIDGDYIYSRDVEVINGKITIQGYEDNATIVLSEDKKSITISGENANITGEYKKVSAYTKEQYFNDYFGDMEYLNSKYNGKYTLEKATLMMYQSDKETVRVFINKEEASSDTAFKIEADGSLREEFLDDVYTIKFGENSVIFETVKGEKKFDGTYIYAGVITIDDIIANFISG